ncbi:glycine cleavage system protein GcvH [Coprothermobacteraceae bacterium]|nr:glycine cleavage system protein GcvH [Coprothermobacteraceae bacterium]
MVFPEELRYSQDHEWVKVVEGNKVLIGITDFAQDELGDIVYVKLPAVGQEIKKDSAMASLESVKSASDVLAPIDGKVIEVNEALNGQPELINQDPYGQGWIALVEAADIDQVSTLMTAEEYKKFIGH